MYARSVDDCIEAHGSRNRQGYVRIYAQGGHHYAHRWAWMQIHGPIPQGMVIMHVCDNPPCMNAEHLRLGTRGDNNTDMWSKGRGRVPCRIGVDITHCVNGHEYTSENTYVRPNGKNPQCRACNRERTRRRRSSAANI